MKTQKWCACLPRAAIERMTPIVGAVLVSFARPGERSTRHIWPSATVRQLPATASPAEAIAATGILAGANNAQAIIVEAGPGPAERIIRQLVDAGYELRVAPASLIPPRKVLYYSPDEIERRLSA